MDKDKDALDPKLVNKLTELINEDELLPPMPDGGPEEKQAKAEQAPPAMTVEPQPPAEAPAQEPVQAQAEQPAQAPAQSPEQPPAEAPAKPHPQKPAAKTNGTDSNTILYIEDNSHNRRIVRKILEHQGYDVQEAEDGLEGYEMIRSLHPPLVLLDIALPTIDGLEILRRLQTEENEHLNEIPVIALTASAMRGDRERFLEAGCTDYLSKPIRAADLITMVQLHHPHHAA